MHMKAPLLSPKLPKACGIFFRFGIVISRFIRYLQKAQHVV